MAISLASANTQFLSKPSAILSAFPVSIAAWVYILDVAASRGIMCIGPSGANASVGLLVGTGDKLSCTRGAAANDATTTVSVPTNSWQHVAGVAQASGSAIYLNGGNKVTNANAVSWIAAALTQIGSLYRAAQTYMNGMIAFPAFWNVVLSDADVAALAAGAHPVLVQPQALVGGPRLTPGTLSPQPDLVSATGWTMNGSPTDAPNPRIYMP